MAKKSLKENKETIRKSMSRAFVAVVYARLLRALEKEMRAIMKEFEK